MGTAGAIGTQRLIYAFQERWEGGSPNRRSEPYSEALATECAI